MLRERVRPLPGQPVASGALLFEIVSLDPIWIRVPVYVGDLREIDAGPSRPGLTRRPDGLDRGRFGVVGSEPVTAPPSADPLAATVDLFYQLEQ